MTLEGLSLQDFRNIPRADLRFVSGLNLVTGTNGQGKTNLLEAVGVLASGRSFRHAPPGAMRRHDQPWFRLRADTRASGLQHRLDFLGQANRMAARLNGKPMTAASGMGRALAAVTLTPDGPALIRGAPGARRDYLDWVIFCADRSHAAIVRDHQTALKARNRLLKTGRLDPAEMDAWEQRLAQLGAAIAHRRQNGLQRLAQELPPFLDHLGLDPNRCTWRITNQQDRFDDPPDPETMATRYQELLASSRQTDARSGFTSIGPHRDDLLFHLDTHPLSRYGSRGQQKRFLLALKLSEAALLKQTLGEPPLLLMDEPAAELDREGISHLTTLLAKIGNQLFLAACDAEEIPWPDTTPKALFPVAQGCFLEGV